MAVPGSSCRLKNLRLDTGGNNSQSRPDSERIGNTQRLWTRDLHDYSGSEPLATKPLEAKNEYSSTPPIPIAIPSSRRPHHDSSSDSTNLVAISLLSLSPSRDEFPQSRRPSVTFDTTLKLDSGERRQMQQPLEKPQKLRLRSSNSFQAITGDRDSRSGSRGQFNGPRRGPFPCESALSNTIAEGNEFQIGQLRHPLLSATVDELARESQTDPAAPMTSDATQSPSIDEARTPSGPQNGFSLSSAPAFLDIQCHPLDDNMVSRRHVDRSQTMAAGFYSRPGSLGRSPMASSARQARRSVSSSTRSPKSAASSFLASFSAGPRNRHLNGHDGMDSVSSDTEGQTVGDDYVLGKKIGFGGFSVIKEAFRVNTDGSQPRKLAAKIVRRNIQGKSEAENEQAQAEFDHEVELWRFFKHPCILPLEAVYKTQDATFCFIPLNSGGTLFDAVRANRSGLPLHLAKRYAYQLATAIRFLHEDARAAHRDIKLENCLLDTSVDPANVRLCDFGMAEWINNDSVSSFDQAPSPTANSADRPPQRPMGPSDSSTSAFAGGSLEYAAPEIVRVAQESPPMTPGPGFGGAREIERGIVSPTGDIWAFGVCVYTLVVGSRPFQDSFPPRVVMAIQAGDWDQARLRAKGGEEALELVRGCLEVDVQDRWDANDVLNCAWLREEVEKGGDEQGGTGTNAFGTRNIWGFQ